MVNLGGGEEGGSDAGLSALPCSSTVHLEILPNSLCYFHIRVSLLVVVGG